MTKHDAISLFKSRRELAKTLGISRAAISQWPEVLSQRLTDEVIGAAIRTGRYPDPAIVTPKEVPIVPAIAHPPFASAPRDIA